MGKSKKKKKKKKSAPAPPADSTTWSWREPAYVVGGLIVLYCLVWVGFHRLAPRDPASLERAMTDAVGYIDNHTHDSGRFVYLTHTERNMPDRSYNVLRHSGTIYSLSQHHEVFGDDTSRELILRAARYLHFRHVDDVSGVPGVKAVFSLPGEESGGRRQAKLGGTALGIIGLVRARELDPEVVPLEDVQALGEFILFMQLDEDQKVTTRVGREKKRLQYKAGQFRAKYDEVLIFKDDFLSLYYPGEAILALTLLYEHDGDVRWLNAALNAIAALVQYREGTVPPPDHWLLIAIGRLSRVYHEATVKPITEEEMFEHAMTIAKGMMLGQRATALMPGMDGALTGNGASTPSSTRLEGLIALHDALPEDHRFRRRLARSVDYGVGFVMRCQVKGTDLDGGFTRTLRKIPGQEVQNRSQGEIRIDYVQHALSAMNGYYSMVTRDQPDAERRSSNVGQ